MIFLSRLKNILFFAGLMACILPSTVVSAQAEIVGIHSVYDDSPIEWALLAYDENDSEVAGELRLKWPTQGNWTEWSIDFNHKTYDIKLRWNSNPQQWELSSDTYLVTIKQKWRCDNTEWDISTRDIKVKWQSEYKYDFNQWYFEDDDLGYFQMWTSWRDDPRDWEIEDNTIGVPDEVKLAAVFITVFLNSPK